ncbi:MAG: SRPBCC family protein, partial [Acidimicrobiia bacterium]|nr:SRPBCC family protein [Acidimicrobiia bacterium]
NDPVTWFSARNISVSTVPVSSERIWELITDPHMLASLTPLVRSIEASGSVWTWTLNGIEGLGLRVEPVFTERMRFTEGRQIVFTHDPPKGVNERAAVEGTYDLTPEGDRSTGLSIDLVLSVDLPLPGLARPAVERVMYSSMQLTGKRYASNLYEELDLDPADVTITEVAPTTDRASDPKPRKE